MAAQDSSTPAGVSARCKLRKASAALALISGSIGALVLIGWALNIPILKSVLPGLVSMKANAALGVVLVALSLWLSQERAGRSDAQLRQKLARATAAVAAALGLLTLSQHIFGWDLGIDQLLFRATPDPVATPVPGRMAVHSAFLSVLLGAGLYLLNSKSRLAQQAAQFCALAGSLISYVAVLGYLYGFVVLDDSSSSGSSGSVAVQAALAFFLLSLGLLCARPEQPPMAVFTQGSFAGGMAPLIVVAFLAPAILGSAKLHGEKAGLYGEDFGVAMIVGATVLTILGLLYWTARSLNRMEEERAQASGYARSLIEASVDPLVTISPEGKITDANEATIKVTGVAREKLIGTDFSNYFTEPRKAEEGYQQVFAEGSVTDYPLTLRHVDGRLLDVLYSASVYRDVNGNVLGVFAAARDITARKAAEEALRASEERFGLAVRGSNDGIWDWDLATHTVFYSPRFKELLGHEEHELTDAFSEFESRLHPSDHERTLQAIQEHLESRVPYDIEYRLRHKDGDYRWFRARGQAIWDDGHAIRMAGSLSDVTEQKQASEYARSLIEVSLDALVTISPEGKITDVNEATVKVTGVAREKLIGTDFSSYFTEPAKAQEGYRQALARGFLTDYPLTIRHVDGRRTDVLYNASVYRDVNGNVLGAFAAARDVTARKAAEEAIRRMNAELEQRVEARTAELRTINQELEAFTYSVSHDLRSPLRHISGFSKFLSEEYGQKLDPNAQRYLERIQEGTRQMGQLVDDLLNLGRIGRQELRLQATGLNSLLEEVRAELSPEDGERQVEWRIGRLPFLECDPALMKLVLQNLVSNALKFTRPRERAVIEVGQFASQGQTVVYVRDNGVGFSMKYADKLFGVFQRLHRPEDFEGTGVGLATVQRILHKHGGRAWAEAELDQGATFYFTVADHGSERTESDLQTVMEAKP